MSNPNPVVDFGDTLAQFLARTNQFSESNQDLVQQKFNKKEANGSSNPVFAALESRSRALAQWANLVDDFMLQFFAQEVASGGGGWTELYRKDLRTVADIDLNAVGSSVVIDGVTWRTPVLAESGSNMVLATTGLDIGATAGGFAVDGANNARANPGAVTGNILYTSLYDLAQNTLTPFDPDPGRSYLWEAYVSGSNNNGTDTGWSGVICFRGDVNDSISNGMLGDEFLARTGYGTINATQNAVEGTGGTTSSPPRRIYDPTGLTVAEPIHDVASLQYDGPRQFKHRAGVWGTDFPALGEHAAWSVSGSVVASGEDVIQHPKYGFFLGFGHVAEAISSGYGATIQQVRLLGK